MTEPQESKAQMVDAWGARPDALRAAAIDAMALIVMPLSTSSAVSFWSSSL